MEAMTKFETGATRSDDSRKIDPEGFLSPLSIVRYCEYMKRHQVQADGEVRPSDNWQKGMPIPRYVKSLNRHWLDVWHLHRGWPAPSGETDDILEALSAMFFNVQGLMHEIIKERMDAREEKPAEVGPSPYEGCANDQCVNHNALTGCTDKEVLYEKWCDKFYGELGIMPLHLCRNMGCLSMKSGGGCKAGISRCSGFVLDPFAPKTPDYIGG